MDLHQIELTGAADDNKGLTLQKKGRKDIKEKKLPTISYAKIDENAQKVKPMLVRAYGVSLIDIIHNIIHYRACRRQVDSVLSI